MIYRYSSRATRLDHVFLRKKLRGAKSYIRIAGYFRSSLFELVHEELASIGEVRIVCNSNLDPRDIGVAKSAYQQSVALKEKWNEKPIEVESVLGRERYQRLYEILMLGNLKVRVVGKTSAALLHGKAGVIETADGVKTSFLGSINESRSGWAENYELLWEDDSVEAIAWVEEEFEYLWAQGIPLPQMIINEIKRCSQRTEYRFVTDCPAANLPAASMVESPIYQRGESLLPWQQAFVGMFLEHRKMYKSARLLLADEVGVGKTLSLATSAVVSSLLGDGPVLILCPATLTYQWQIELWDKLGIPSAVWTNKKTWLDHTGHHIRTRGAEEIVNCPYQIGIVSTGLIFRKTTERDLLLERRYGTIILDEAHRARRSGGFGENAGAPNNLLRFMLEAAKLARHVLLGTATPIQTDIEELWDLLEILNRGAEHVLGRYGSLWRQPEKVLDIVTGKTSITAEVESWELLRNPLPPVSEDPIFDYIRSDLELPENEYFTSKSFVELDTFTREDLKDKLSMQQSGLTFFQTKNPIVRYTVLRKRVTLEEKGLLPRIAVDIHPSRENQKPFFVGIGLLTSSPIDRAYEAAEEFTALLCKRTRAAGFLKNLILQRICSSLASGLSTAKKLLDRETLDEDEDTETSEELKKLSIEEKDCLQRVVNHLSEKPDDPKYEAVCHYLFEEPKWLEKGCIIFSQYYDTAYWIAESLAKSIPNEPIAIYAGSDRSGFFREENWVSVNRESIKQAVKEREVRLVVATDAACEGLNLQTLGTLINVDLPWNPSRLEQRIGRIKRIGQSRDSVEMLNLVYHDTRDEAVYERLSKRMKDRYDIFGSLPDVIEDEWIENIETFDEKLSEYIEKTKRANAFEFRYSDTIDPKGEPWENCANVLSRKDVIEHMSKAW